MPKSSVYMHQQEVFSAKRVLIFDIVEAAWGAGATGIPSVSVYVLIHRRGKHNCKPLSIKHTTYTHSYTQTQQPGENIEGSHGTCTYLNATL
jgi:hypothetical protein